MTDAVYLGIDVREMNNFTPLHDKRVGLYTKASGVDSRRNSRYDILTQAENINIVAFFAPEHGIARPHTFITYASKYKNQICHNIQVYPHHPSIFKAIEAWLIVLDTVRILYTNHFNWLVPDNKSDRYHFDRLIGIPNFRESDDFVLTLRQHSDISIYTSLWDNLTLYDVKELA